jgi:membrane-bound serine protease (ClpP class)
MTFNNVPQPYSVSKPLVVSVAVGLGLIWAFAIGKAMQVRRRPATVGAHTLVGAEGQVRRDGLVFLNGELWQARAADGEPLRPGETVRVDRLDGLTLEVHHHREPVGST